MMHFIENSNSNPVWLKLGSLTSAPKPAHHSSPVSFRTAARVSGDTRKRLAWSRSISSLTLVTKPARLALMSRPRVPITEIFLWSATCLARPSSSTTTTSAISPSAGVLPFHQDPSLWSSDRVELPVGGRIVSHLSALTSGRSIPKALPSSLTHHSGRDEDRPGESRQDMEKSELMEILEWRCVADDFRQGEFLSGVARR